MRTVSLLILGALPALAAVQPVARGQLAERTPEQLDQIEAGIDLYKRLCSGPVTRDCSTCLRSGACYKARDAVPLDFAKRSPEQLEAAAELHKRLCDGTVTRSCSTCLRSGACYKA